MAASAVAIAWLPLLTESGQREIQNEVRQLQTIASLGAGRVRRHLDDTTTRPTPDELGPLLESIRTEAGLEELWLIDNQGTLLVSVPAGQPPNEASVAAARQLCADGQADSYAQAVAQSIEFISGSAALRAACSPVHTEDPVFAVVLDRAESAGPLALARRRATALMFGLGSVVALIVIGGIRWLLAPVQRISVAAGRIAEGERGVRLTPGGPEEIAQLARAINLLASSVETREDEIHGRLDVVSQLTSLVAHEVRNPLQSLSLLTTLARTEDDADTRAQLLTTMEEEINGLEQVVQRLLRTSGPLRIAPNECDVVELVNRATTIAEPKARSCNVRLMVQAPAKLAATVDGSLLRRAVENLMLNAIEFAGQEPPGQVTITIMRHGENARVVVDDDGPGVPEEELNRIFQPFYSSKAGGTGLGLALCKRVFKAHGGSLHCGPSPLGGARFVGTVPLRPKPPKDAA